MVAFTDSQLRAVWAAADRVPFEKRGIFVERVVARLQLQRGFTDADLDDAVAALMANGRFRRRGLSRNNPRASSCATTARLRIALCPRSQLFSYFPAICPDGDRGGGVP